MDGSPKIIAIDGPAASGKGTLARAVAKRLGYAYMDTGLLYRAVASKLLKNNGNLEDTAAAVEAAHFVASSNPDALDKNELRGEAVGNGASKMGAIPDVRAVLFAMQRDFAVNPGVGFNGAVLDGRDIGTVICPESPAKLYITASLEIRTARRLKELQSNHIETTYDTVLRDMRDRDERDAARATVPMKPAHDAVILDTSELTAVEALEKALKIIAEKMQPSLLNG